MRSDYETELYIVKIRNDPTPEDEIDEHTADKPGHIAYAEIRIRANNIDDAISRVRETIRSEQPVRILSVAECN